VGDATLGIQSPTELHWSYSNTSLGIGTISPAAKIDLQGASTADGLRVRGGTAMGSTSGAGITLLTHNNPTDGTPSAANQRLGVLFWAGFLGSATIGFSPQIRGYSSQAWSAGNGGSYLQFLTTPDASTTPTGRWRIDQDGTFRPEANNTYDFGTTSQRVKKIWSVDADLSGVITRASGVLDIVDSGDPEGNVTAPVGSMFRRSDGGAGTTLYIKESGTGNTGWIAK
jgi:hypothetical protein